MPDLMRNFENQRDNLRELTKYRKRIGNYHLLILDEWLNYKVTEKDAKLLYELFISVFISALLFSLFFGTLFVHAPLLFK